jgi:ferrous iron transport protein A
MHLTMLSGIKGLSSICSPRPDSRILNSDQSGRIFRVLPFQRPSGVRRVSVLSELRVGETGVLVALDLPESVQNHLMHMGFVPEARVTALRRAPAGDPTVYAVDGIEIALRRETASAIQVRAAEAQTALRSDAETEAAISSKNVGAKVEPAGIPSEVSSPLAWLAGVTQ